MVSQQLCKLFVLTSVVERKTKDGKKTTGTIYAMLCVFLALLYRGWFVELLRSFGALRRGESDAIYGTFVKFLFINPHKYEYSSTNVLVFVYCVEIHLMRYECFRNAHNQESI